MTRRVVVEESTCARCGRVARGAPQWIDAAATVYLATPGSRAHRSEQGCYLRARGSSCPTCLSDTNAEAAIIEIVIGAYTIRVLPGVDAVMLKLVLLAVKAVS